MRITSWCLSRGWARRRRGVVVPLALAAAPAVATHGNLPHGLTRLAVADMSAMETPRVSGLALPPTTTLVLEKARDKHFIKHATLQVGPARPRAIEGTGPASLAGRPHDSSAPMTQNRRHVCIAGSERGVGPGGRGQCEHAEPS